MNDVRRITEDYIRANTDKRNILKKQVSEYFSLLKGEIENLYHEVEHSLDNLRF